LQRRDKFIHRQHCAGRIFARFRVATKRRFPRFRVATTGYIPPEPGLHQKEKRKNTRSTIATKERFPRCIIATKLLIPPESGLHQKGSLARCRNPAKGSFPRVGIATIHSFLQSQDCNTNAYSSRVRIAT